MLSISSIWHTKDELLALVLALRDKRTPLIGRVCAVFSVLYLLSPLDVVFDTIPLIGIIDDLVIVPLGIWMTRTFIPDNVLEAARSEAAKYSGKLNTVIYVLLVFLLLWCITIGVLLYGLVSLLIG